ncbi:hypothetical protein [Pseudoxanthomonas mexicana]|uniref:hypothetical protein n=1 Tax=Pseudoxanthomonas mexicana TaxID=128785 RepID=UPI00398B5311
MPFPRLALVLLAATLLLPALTATAANQRKQAQLRISLTLVDGCDIRLPADPGAAGQDTRVECSDDLPHHFALQPPPRASAGNAPGDGRPAPSREEPRAASLPEASPGAVANGEVTVAVVTF